MTVRVNLDLPNDFADAVDAVARGLAVSRNRVLVAAVEEFLRSRVLIAPACEPDALPPQAPTQAGAIARTRSKVSQEAVRMLRLRNEAGESLRSLAAEAGLSHPALLKRFRRLDQQSRDERFHPWNERVDVTREQPSLRSRHGAGR
jgi:predicted transcriptional regulator